MGRTEELLRDAVTALAGTLDAADIPALALGESSDSRRREWSFGRPARGRRVLIPVCAAASVAGIVAALVVAGSMPRPAGHRTRPGRALPAGTTQLRLASRYDAARSWTIWQVAGTHSSDLAVTAMTAISPASAWAFGSDNAGTDMRPVAWRLTRSSWTAVSFPGLPGEQVVAAQASSTANVWAFTSDNRALRWNGSSWTVVAGFPGRDIGSALVISRSDVWVFGQIYQPGQTHSAWHYNGQDWTRVPSASQLAQASAVAADDIWATGWSAVAHWNGTGWAETSVAALLPARSMYCSPMVTDIYGASATDAWAVGYQNCQDTGGLSVLLHYAEGSWRRVASLGDLDVEAVLPDGQGGLWLPANVVQGTDGIMLHYSAGKLTRVQLAGRAGQIHLWHGASTPGGTAIFVAGAAGADGTAIVIRHGR